MRVDGRRRYIQLMGALVPEEDDDTGPGLPYRHKTHVIPITHHTAADRTSTCPPRAYMVFNNYTPILLPTLFPIVIYFTHPNPGPSPSAQLPNLLRAITDRDDDFEPRLDVYFLPGASASDCVSHYTQEQVARGTSAAQVRAFNSILLRWPGHPWDWDFFRRRRHRRNSSFASQDLLDSDDDDDNDDDDGPNNLNHNPATMAAPAGGEEEKEKGGQSPPAATTTPDGTRPREPLMYRAVWPINDSSPAVDEAYGDWPMDKWMVESFYYADDGLKHTWQKASSLGWTHWI
ncbi:hypothetical protein BJX68DRAFT_268906 [Aspergillus pseudodeflectus]|uniref:Uncharacterized protein n=1 Tax=Aspergillus pseudodeflectus TaxID=176178 RepID=A0ABR4K1H8_9EURO